jgi:CheY-like chemotaxis protein
MVLLTLFSMPFVPVDVIASRLAAATGYGLLTDEDLLRRASEVSGLSAARVAKAFQARLSVFNRFTCEKERSIAALRLSLAEELTGEGLIVCGFSSQLLPGNIFPTLRIFLRADLESRVWSARRSLGVSAQEALQRIQRDDEDQAAWVKRITGAQDPWNEGLYDLVFVSDKATEAQIVDSLLAGLPQTAEQASSGEPRMSLEDFLLASRVEALLASEGHIVSVSAEQGEVFLGTDKAVLFPDQLREELDKLARSISGVRSVCVRMISPSATPAESDSYRKCDFSVPSRVLLVDDEREFVQTLSERLMIRDVCSVVAYDGESALECVCNDGPEVMILDLKMPGMSGIEVLRRAKKECPEIQVIIVTGHGTETERKICMELGAFACFQKPVDIDTLCRTLREAADKASQCRHYN